MLVGWALLGVQVGHKVSDTAVVLVLHLAAGFKDCVFAFDDVSISYRLRFTFVFERQRQAAIEERHFLESAREDLEVVVRGFEDVAIGPERDGGSGAISRLALGQRCLWGAGVVALAPNVAFAVDLDLNVGR